MRVSQRYTRNELPQTEAIQALLCTQVIAELEKERRICDFGKHKSIVSAAVFLKKHGVRFVPFMPNLMGNGTGGVVAHQYINSNFFLSFIKAQTAI